MNVLIDTNILGKLCHPHAPSNKPVVDAFEIALLSNKYLFLIPEIVDYELRRKYLHQIYSSNTQLNNFGKNCLSNLDVFCNPINFLPLNTNAMKKAADLWGNARAIGKGTSSPTSLDADVILAGQAIEANGIVLTENVKHLSVYVNTLTWQNL